jgi:hypothetical protein
MITNRAEELMEQLKQNAIVEVLGVVQASGASGGRNGKELNWTLKFAFEVWKYSNGEIQNRKLTICKSVSNEELRLHVRQIRPFDVIRIRARIAEQNSFGSPQGLLVELVGKDISDAGLNQFALKLQEPVTFEDVRFGIFTLDRRLNLYEAKTSWGSINIGLSLPPDDREEIKKILTQAYLLWDSRESWSDRIANYATTKLLGLKNKTWLGEDETELSAEQFRSKMKLESISMEPNGDFEFWFDDGDLFWGHAIRVSGNLSDGPTDAEIAG